MKNNRTKLICKIFENIIPIVLTLGIFVFFLCALSGCSTLEKAFIVTPTDEIKANPIVTDTIDSIGDTVSTFGVPYARLSGEVWAALAGAVALIMTERERRKEKKVNATLIKGVESVREKAIKQAIKRVAERDGTEADLNKRVAELT